MAMPPDMADSGRPPGAHLAESEVAIDLDKATSGPWAKCIRLAIFQFADFMMN
jgi:hypothetical protein